MKCFVLATIGALLIGGLLSVLLFHQEIQAILSQRQHIQAVATLNPKDAKSYFSDPKLYFAEIAFGHFYFIDTEITMPLKINAASSMKLGAKDAELALRIFEKAYGKPYAEALNPPLFLIVKK